MKTLSILLTELGSDRIATVQVAEDSHVENLQLLVEAEFGIQPERQLLTKNSVPLHMPPGRTVKSCGISDNDMLLVSEVPQSQSSGPNIFDPSQEPSEETYKSEAARLINATTPAILSQLSINIPELADALRDGNVDAVASFLKTEAEKRRATVMRNMEVTRRLEANEFDVEAQKELEQLIQQRNINESLANAQEHLPEAFASVTMLYIHTEVNGIPVKAFVDSGAQSTIMSRKMAAKCNLLRLIDRRFQGIARGVGTSQIVGRIHMAQMRIGDEFYAASFTVLEDDKVDFLFGLDMLRRLRCVIDLQSDCLRIGDKQVPFLGEKDLKDTIFARTDSSPMNELTPQSRGLAQNEISENKITSLMELGCTREEAIAALRATGGNLDAAGAIVFRGH